MSIRSGNQANSIVYVYDLPYTDRKALCNILDMNDEWEVLGGEKMNFTVIELSEIKRAERCGNSPTDKLLNLWGRKNNTILQLYLLLYEMDHYQAMNVLQSFVPEDYSLENAAKAELSLEPKVKFPSKPPSHLLEPSGRMPNPNLNQTAVVHSNVVVDGKEKHIKCKILDPMKSAQACSLQTPNIAGKRVSLFDSQQKIMNQLPIFPKPPSDKSLKTVSTSNLSVKSKDKQYAKKTDTKATTSLNESVYSKKDNTIKHSNNSNKTDHSVMSVSSTVSECGIPKISFKDLEDITFNWKSALLLGRGGFGTVYKGNWKNTDVAIKKIKSLTQDGASNNKDLNFNQTLDELRYLQKFRHCNILQLYAYSYEPEHPFCLIYEFMSNGSLEYRLQCKRVEALGDKHRKPLNWYERFYIAKGVAAALQYIHTAIPEMSLIHGDVKSANILLDKNLEPKLGDFGLAKEGPENKKTSIQVTSVYGTRAYIPEDYRRSRKMSNKVDVYSYGIVLLEICTGKKAYDENSKIYLKDYVESCLTIAELKDKRCGIDPLNIFEILLSNGKSCIQSLANNRPEMELIFCQMENYSKALRIDDYNPRHSTDDSTIGSSIPLVLPDSFPLSPSQFQTYTYLQRVSTPRRTNPIPGSYYPRGGYQNFSRSSASHTGMPSQWIMNGVGAVTVYPYPLHIDSGHPSESVFGKTNRTPNPQNDPTKNPNQILESAIESLVPDISALLAKPSSDSVKQKVPSDENTSDDSTNSEDDCSFKIRFRFFEKSC